MCLRSRTKQNCKSAILEISLTSVVSAPLTMFILNIFLKRLNEFTYRSSSKLKNFAYNFIYV
ncbi:hypothetical protein CN520_00300 [Bacillus cereus]|nr:hypothetical protein CON18_12830 [Bacillus cereus]PET43994.1 hypothetical protein CN520_00300 [Bacillus cereus]PFA16760.1 hypothetical protein CN377_06870 [Bacillus cereus]PFS81188.1 hypothetical protein COK49_11365 [Bacillus cereus]PFW05811.1 hypothetical protein COL12_20045 [Bacillus cereus]